MDPLSHVFETANVKAAVFARLNATAPWGFRSRGGTDLNFALVLTGGEFFARQQAPNLSCSTPAMSS